MDGPALLFIYCLTPPSSSLACASSCLSQHCCQNTRTLAPRPQIHLFEPLTHPPPPSLPPALTTPSHRHNGTSHPRRRLAGRHAGVGKCLRPPHPYHHLLLPLQQHPHDGRRCRRRCCFQSPSHDLDRENPGPGRGEGECCA